MSDVTVPTDAELAAFVEGYGLPVRITVGDGRGLLIGWIDEADRDDPMAALYGLLMQAIDEIERMRGTGDP